MDYQLIRNDFNKPEAVFSGDHLALGYFLTSELADNKEKINTIQAAIARAEARATDEFKWIGKEYKLSITNGEVLITALVLDHELYDELPESTQLYDKEQKIECGLSDFSAVIEDWLFYISD